jgi:hypothetical protein
VGEVLLEQSRPTLPTGEMLRDGPTHVPER